MLFWVLGRLDSEFGNGNRELRLAATVLFHVPSASKLRGSACYSDSNSSAEFPEGAQKFEEPLDAYHTSIVVGQACSARGFFREHPLLCLKPSQVEYSFSGQGIRAPQQHVVCTLQALSSP